MKKQKYVATIIIIGINIVIYCVTCYNMKYLVEFGLNLQDIISNFEIYRIFTFMFINDLRGILLTTVFFSYFGKVFEKKHGTKKLLFSYIFIGATAGIVLLLLKYKYLHLEIIYDLIRKERIIAGSLVPTTGLIGYQLGEGKNPKAHKIITIVFLILSYTTYWNGVYTIHFLDMLVFLAVGFLCYVLKNILRN